MSNRFSFHTQLSSIMEMMARTALSRVYKLVDEDSAELRSELCRALTDNAALIEKLHSLECELTIMTSKAPKLHKDCRSIAVQTGGSGDRASRVTGTPTIEGIFGKEWCINLWEDKDPYSLERVRYSTQCSDKSVVPFSDQIIVTKIKDETTSNCPQKTPDIGVHEEYVAHKTEGPSIEYSIDDSNDSLSADQEEEQVLSAGGLGEPYIQLTSIDGAEGYGTYVIPVDEEEEDDDDDDDDNDDDDEEDDDDDEDDDYVPFIQKSQSEPTKNEHHTLAADSENTGPDRDTPDNMNIFNLETTSGTNIDKFTCQICGRTFFHKGTLTHHMKTHRPNFCHICKQHFPQKHKLETHLCVPPVPSQKFSNACKLCGKTFATQSALKIHYVVHTGEKPHRCSLCGKGFTQKGNLKCHLRVHTGERPFRCGKCGKSFTQKVNLNHHLMAHRNKDDEDALKDAVRHLSVNAQ
ncbi:uncharacterized protein ACJ7VT_021412 [Polymixia lowei]